MPNSTGYHSHLWVFNHLFAFKTQVSVVTAKYFLFSGWCTVKEPEGGECKSELNNVLCRLFLRSLIY